MHSSLVALSEKIGSLEARLTTTNALTNTKKTNPPKEREFWFIQDRVRYLGLTISADQRLKIEMFANANYQERHGQPPSGNYLEELKISAYPAADLDILDVNIRGLTKGR